LDTSIAATGSAYRSYVLAVLTVVYTLGLMDRGLISLLLQPIKEDLRLSDTELGFLTGIAFALFYATLGLPIARWADRSDRVTITSLAIGVWGVTVMACLFVSTFVQLLFARIAAAVGEAGCMPPTYSLVGDYFRTPVARARAMAVYMLANPFCNLASFIVGGYLNARYGWRMTFFIAGIPGLLLAAVVRLTIREPRLRAAASVRRSDDRSPRMTEVLAHLWSQPSVRNLMIAIVLLFTMGLGLQPWYAAFLMRSHGMDTAAVGLWLGLIFGIGGIIGTLGGAYVATRWFGEDAQSQTRLSALMIGSLVIFFVPFLLLPGKYQALSAFVGMPIALFVFIGPTYALLQRLVPDEMRATTLSVSMLLANLIGMGIGPQVVGILSDLLHPSFGAESLRYAMLIMSFIAPASGFYFWCAARTVNRDLLSVAASRIEKPA
jgi:predicted MFS family arabinose efflux permease